MITWLKEKWCDWFHGGGHIKRDCYGRINWQCDRCGRWGAPVDKQTEALIIERDIEQRMKKMTIEREQIARVCHEVNRAYCQAIGDMSQPTWEDAAEWQKQSALLGVNLHCNSDVGPEASHESWMAQKIADGWVFGETKDPEAKTHPCIVPFAELPREQQAKDFIFRAVVHALRND